MPAPPPNPRKGQSLIETSLAVALICLLFMGLLQIARLVVAREILDYAAACGARARTVGFNTFMTRKVVRAAAIPNAGRLIHPAFTNESPFLRARVGILSPGRLWDETLAESPTSARADFEKARIPDYLGAENEPRARIVLDYEDWNTIHFREIRMQGAPGVAVQQFTVEQDLPLRTPLHRAFYAADHIRLEGRADTALHCALYLDDLGW